MSGELDECNPPPSTTDTPPVFRNGRAQILATAIGEESFDDVNSSGYYRPATLSPIWASPISTPMRAAHYVNGDYFLDYFSTAVYEGPSGKFIGITCTGSLVQHESHWRSGWSICSSCRPPARRRSAISTTTS